MKARQAAREAATRFAAAGVDECALEAEVLVRAASGLSRAQYFAGHEIQPDDLSAFHNLVGRRLTREPAAYILGEREFYGRRFEVTADTLVPRPETELLVDIALRALHPADVVVDVGTGTGCIVVSVALGAPHAMVVATDTSQSALAVARRNRASHEAAVQLLAGDLLSAVRRADIVLANLPYIASDALRSLEPEVRDYEPRLALDGGPDGLVLVRRLIDDCAQRLRPRLLALEVGCGQAKAVVAYAHRQGAAATEVQRDLAGIERVVCARWA